jgi:tetratricopeptide (TPR) repeat protein
MAAFLSLSPKTIDNYIYNIMIKLECHSRENIIDFIEKSGKFPIIKQYYANLLIDVSFKNILKEVPCLVEGKFPVCVIIPFCEKAQQEFIHERLIKHLKITSLKVLLKSLKQYEVSLKNTGSQPTHVLFIVSTKYLASFLKQEEAEGINTKGDKAGREEIKIPTIIKIIQNTRQSFFLSSFTFLLLDRERTQKIPKAIAEVDYIEFQEHTNYYIALFSLLKRIFPDLKLDKIMATFARECFLIYGSSDTVDFQAWPKIQKILRKETVYKFAQNIGLSFFKNKKKRKRPVLFLCLYIACIVIIISIVLVVGYNYDGVHKNMTSVRSDLIMPSDPTLLTRPELLTQIKESLKGTQPIKTVALVGIAGSGKTTIARQYARMQEVPVVWEINAETKEALMGSFETLAQALAKTEEDQRVLRGIQEIKNAEQREKKIYQFVKDFLKSHRDWILIYDNVENFADLQDQFPQDNDAWGQGRVIVTTRDSTIQNMRTIFQVIPIKELDQREKLTLFMKIINHGMDLSWTPTQNEEADTFLRSIPPFPLDISIAAYYIKSTNISYERYLKRLEEHHKDFIEMQENVLKGTSDYSRARYSIISLSLDHLLEMHQDFPYLLLFMSLLDSQNIPRDLLETHINGVSLDNFIFNLKKYSLITSYLLPPYPWGILFSIHRSTQEISLAYLTERLDLKPNSQLIQRITQNLETYVKQLIEKEDLLRLQLLTNHCETFLSHHILLTEEEEGSLSVELGGMYLSLGKYAQAKQILKDTLLKLNSNNNDDDNTNTHYQNKDLAKKAQVLAYLGNIYGDLGEYEKAKDFLEESLFIYKKDLPTDYGGTAWALTYLGNVYRDLGDPEKAKDLLEKSLHIYQTYLPENNAGNARASAYLGIVYTILGNYEKSKTLLEHSLHIYTAHLSKNHVGVSWVSAHLGNAYGELGDYEKARQLLEQSILLYKEHFSEDHIKVGWALSYLGDVYRVTGEYEKAKQALEKSMAIYKKHLPENHIVIAGILVYLSDIHKDLGEYEKAQQLLEQSITIYEKHFPANHPETAWALAHLGDIYRIMGNFEKAEYLLEKSLMIYRQHFSEDHNEIIWTLERLQFTHKKDSNYRKDQVGNSKR